MASTAAHQPIFQEWQLPNLSSFLPNLLLAPAVWLVFAPINQMFGTVLGLALTALSIVMRFLVAKRIIVTSTSLQVGKADIPRSALGEARVIAVEDQFAERGAKLDARAFLALKGGLPGLVKVSVTDQSDPTPYLLISTRSAEGLVKALKG